MDSPLLHHLVVALTAFVVTAGITPVVVRLARRLGALDHPGDGRRVHTRAVPTLGGLAMLAGVLAALAVAWALGGPFAPLFASTSEPVALLVGALVIVLVGVADDLVGLPPTVKLAGQIVAALGVVLFGMQLVYVWVPGVEIVALSSDLGLVVTILALVAMINAVNLIDGLDGLAAGVCVIAALAFFAFSVATEGSGIRETLVPSSATLIAAVVAGIGAGFLVHNWHPARIFMGDTGAMLLGLLLGAAGVSYTARSTSPSNTDFYGSIPLLVPVLVLAIPFLDSAFAVVRRALQRRPLATGDRGHLHHLLIAFGHSHRRAVLVLYYWSALLAFGSVGPTFVPMVRLLPWLLVAAGVGLALTALGTQARGEDTAPEAGTRPGTRDDGAPPAPPRRRTTA
ncbi:glycosyltransferase family 4 protein [Egicoccus halophilus]|uniref:Undecaprenyl-phosphate alpha-N-acetylglucosaminyl 1-phosphate transferase n=1 Tax=Egicoccus halophilus TaxID=1670830 RepID=A0A8J3A5W6_9ACTN|nr:MraY family glycosyltransferase [Egicoccus halophilus]GGI04025.1 undecaprenyl-phosphate alpha-N-acetylglucosaminyl 1-phosphate transferase [Egicoccus halophilus]